jgi:HNH endonuclease
MAKSDWRFYWDAFVDARGRCAYCDADLDVARTAETLRYHVDHLIPRQGGGANTQLNAVLACHPCNRVKKDWDPRDPGQDHSAPRDADERRHYIQRVRDELRLRRRAWQTAWAPDVAAMVAEARGRETNAPEAAADKEADHPWRGLLEQFGLQPHELDRLALFLLAHAQLDRWLIHAIAVKEFSDRVKRGATTPDSDAAAALDALISEYAQRTFGTHMGRANQAGLLRLDLFRICDEVNEARNHFLHWKPGRFRAPTYRGQLVTTEAGFLQCLSDIDKVVTALVARIDAT